jgi:hypothetical protein
MLMSRQRLVAVKDVVSLGNVVGLTEVYCQMAPP